MIIHNLLAQVSETTALKTTGEIGVAVLFIGKLVDIYTNWREAQDRKKHTEEFIKQTEVLRSIDDTQKAVRTAQLNDTQIIAIANDRQVSMKTTLERVDRNVRDLKLMAGIPDTETTITKKEEKK